MHVLHVVGARPNFMKVAPVHANLRRLGLPQTLVHTGQHYDANMSEIFFQQLELPRPDVFLNVGSASHAVQTADIMTRFEQALLDRRPDLVLVYGDVNSTVAAALVSAKIQLPVGHVEAGLRSFDRTMPEELNRILTDQLSDLLFTPSADADHNLLREGIAAEKIHRVGNVMIDSLVRLLPRAVLPAIDGPLDNYALVTLHRPANVDSPPRLRSILQALCDVSNQCRIIFPVHPRTRQRIYQARLDLPPKDAFTLLEPVGYLECLGLQQQARLVITDSGGLQEETTYLGVPCLTLRGNTERPVTVSVGTNVLIRDNLAQLGGHVSRILKGQAKRGTKPEFWDGLAGQRIADIVHRELTTPSARSRTAA